MLVRPRLPLKSSSLVERGVRGAAASTRLVLAVSGGRDSMAMMHAAARVAPHMVKAVATFDHGTGPGATQAAELVRFEAERLGLPYETRTAESSLKEASEATWRAARMEFLRGVAARNTAVLATAHTRDDQVETVLMRVLRGAGARGLAGLYARGDIARPLLEVSRAEVAEYADAVGARWIDDPTNDSMRFFRNRVRRDLLPAIQRVRPGFDDELLDIARRAAKWRDQVDAFAEAISQRSPSGDRISVAVDDLAEYSRADLSVLWPAIAARVGLAMDWRGTVRAAAFTTGSRVGARIQLSGGWEISRMRHLFELYRPGGRMGQG